MSIIAKIPTPLLLAAPVIAFTSSALAAQQQDAPNPNPSPIVVTGERDHQTTGPGPEVKGIITARHAYKFKVTAADGTSTIIALSNDTRIKASSGLFGGGAKLGPEALLNGLPVTVKTLQSADGLVASQVTFRNGDFKTANMIRNGTAQGFEEQTAATAALKGRLGDIDKYNVKGTTNVYFDTGKWTLSPTAKTELCQAATQAEANENALLLVVGYTDSVGSDDFNQTLSEKRAGAVINYLQQACHWKPYRVLTPTGMAKADPVAPNDTPEGKAQNRRVAVNVLVSKSVDGM